jgi:hypothetical protein
MPPYPIAASLKSRTQPLPLGAKGDSFALFF